MHANAYLCAMLGIALGAFYLLAYRNRLRHESAKRVPGSSKLSLFKEAGFSLGKPIVVGASSGGIIIWVTGAGADVAPYLLIVLVIFVGTIIGVICFSFVVVSRMARKALQFTRFNSERWNVAAIFLYDGWKVSWNRVLELQSLFEQEQQKKATEARVHVDSVLLAMAQTFAAVLQKIDKAKIRRADEIYQYLGTEILHPVCACLRNEFNSSNLILRLYRRSADQNKTRLNHAAFSPPGAPQLPTNPHVTDSVAGHAMRTGECTTLSRHPNHAVDLQQLTKKILDAPEISGGSRHAVPLYTRIETKDPAGGGSGQPVVRLDDSGGDAWSCWGVLTVDIAEDPAYDFEAGGLLTLLHVLADYMDVIRAMLAQNVQTGSDFNCYNHPLLAQPPARRKSLRRPPTRASQATVRDLTKLEE